MATPINVVVLKCRKICSTGESVKSCIIRMTKKRNFGSLSNCRYYADRAQNLPGPAPTFGSQCSRFHPNLLTFGGVIAERVNAVFLPHRVFLIFARSDASLRANNKQYLASSVSSHNRYSRSVLYQTAKRPTSVHCI